MKSNPGKCMTIYDLPSVAKKALPKASAPTNIISGYKKTGIVPFNRHAFEEREFVPAIATDRNEPKVAAESVENVTLSVDAVALSVSNLNLPSTVTFDSVGTSSAGHVVEDFSSSSLRPLQKSPPGREM